MSFEKYIKEARRRMDTARGDIDSVGILYRNEKYPHTCFHAKQAADKSLKDLCRE